MERSNSDNETNRFTLADYDYDRSDADTQAEMNDYAYHQSRSAYTYPHAESSGSARAGYTNARLPTLPQDSVAPGSLRLHEYIVSFSCA